MRWLELDRGRRQRVARAVRKGQAVADPRDAPYAVGFADASLDWLSWKRRFRPLHLLLLTVVLAELVLTGGWRPALVLYPLVGFAFLRLRAPRLRKRATAARGLNRELAEQLQLAPVAVEMPARSLFRPGTRARRRFVMSFTAVLVGLVALAVAAAFGTIRQNHRWSARANPICAAEHARLSTLEHLQLDPVERQLRRNAIDRNALVALGRLPARTRLQRQLLAWRRYEVELDGWLLGRLEADDRAGVALGRSRLRSARETSRKLAGWIGAKVCADV